MPGSRIGRLLTVVTLGVFSLVPISTLAVPDSTTSPPSAPTQVLILHDFQRIARAIVAWTLDRRYIVGGSVLVAVQSSLIVMLLVQHSKRRRAEGELASRLRFETLLADLSALFVARSGADIHQQIQVALQRLGDELRIDRVTVGEYAAVGDNIRVTHAWTREGTASLPVVIARSHMPWVDSQIHQGQAVYIARYADLPAEAARDRRTLAALGTRSLAVLPLVMSDTVAGLLALAITREEREWSGELTSRLTLLAEVFASTLARHRAEQALEEVRRHREEIAHVQRVTTLSELAAGLAHEISQPLTAIVANAQAASRLLDAGPSERNIVRDALADIRQDSQRASRIIHGLRALLRREQADYHPVSVNALIEDVVALLRSDFQRKGIAVVLSLNPTVPRPLGDPTQLQQVLLNVLVNAGEAIDAVEGGPREIAITTAYRAPDLFEVTVRDTGVGVPEAELEQIFTRFKSGKSGGLGMGLTICRSIVQQHGGRIWPTLNPGGGLTMHIELPLEKMGPPVGGGTPARFQHHPGSGGWTS